MVLFSKLRKMPKNVSFFCLLSIYCTYTFCNKTIYTHIRNTLEIFCAVLFIFSQAPHKTVATLPQKTKPQKLLPCFGFFAIVFSYLPPDHKTLPRFTVFLQKMLVFDALFAKRYAKTVFLLLFYSFLLKPVFAIRVSKNNKILDFKRSFLRVFLTFRVFL